MILCSCCDRRQLYNPGPCGCRKCECCGCILCERHCGCRPLAWGEVEEAEDLADERFLKNAAVQTEKREARRNKRPRHSEALIIVHEPAG